MPEQVVHMRKESKYPEDSFGQQRETWRRAYVEARSVRERFPSLERLTLHMTFIDAQKIGAYSPQMRSFSVSAKAFFAFACPRTLCLHGGFDLDPIIQSLFKTERAKSSGTLRCQGWLHRLHSDNARCCLQLHYALHLLYEVQKSAPSGRGTSA